MGGILFHSNSDPIWIYTSTRIFSRFSTFCLIDVNRFMTSIRCWSRVFLYTSFISSISFFKSLEA